MPDPQRRYSITDLADLAGVTPRTVRFYLSQGLLPSPGATGSGVKYGEDQLDRLRLIRRLQREHLPLAEIRTRLAGLDGSSIAMLADEVLKPDAIRDAPDAPDSALDYVRRLLEPGPRTASAMTRMHAAPAPAPASAVPPLMKRAALSEAPAPYLPAQAAPAKAPEPPRSPDSTLERSQWDRIELATDIELHVRRPLPRHLSRKVDRLVTIARELLEEDPS
jgi:DNA-binding transcriptional MerR regulator